MRVLTICMLTYLLFAPGISLKTQELYVIIFVTRYLDLFTRYISFYNSVMKLVFLGISIAIVWYMRHHKVVKQTYNKDEDTFRHYFLILSCFVLALLIPHEYNTIEVLNFLVSFFLCFPLNVFLAKENDLFKLYQNESNYY
ncbi:hypothetical protein Patl1_24415 [Pistacia atlantica]|uniref:Uncharacterized protein n=1 Tax=Pistacia atlantica TaxID=434234 RepID=A0ACC1A069_9ROSI|nr:hypothetical protein Patl1_24415 [Pistacia atlantica]